MRRVILACGVVWIALISIVSIGCSAPFKSVVKDGRGTLVIRCDAADSLSVCHDQAKDACPGGYSTISETTGVNRKELRVICKSQSDSVTKGNSAGAARPSAPK
jgi:hypothetical protein